MAGTGRRLGWLLLSLGSPALLAQTESPATAVAPVMPSRELLLYLAEFESDGDAEPIDPLELDALPSTVAATAAAPAEADDEQD